MRATLIHLLCWPVRLTLMILLVTVPAQASQQPNIIFIMSDDTGYADLGVYGSEATQTPNLDRMADEGIRFTNAYSGSPLCAPARSTLMTGLHTGRTAVRGNLGGTPMPADTLTWAQIMQDAGYVVGGFGKWGLGDVGTEGVPEDHGFDEFVGYYHQVHAHDFYTTHIYRNSERIDLPGNVDFDPGPPGPVSHEPQNGNQPVHTHYKIVEQMKQFIRDNSDRPFVAYGPWLPPHFRYHIPDDELAWQLYKDQDWPMNARVHATMNTMVDRHVGEILKLLDELGISERTLVIFCSDNGAAQRWEGHLDSSGPLRGRKMSLYEGGIRVPFIARWPGMIESGQITDALTYFPDMMPTFAELAEASNQVPEQVDGLSIVPTLLKNTAAVREQTEHDFLYFENAVNAYGQGEYHWPQTLSQAVRIGDWKGYRSEPDAPIELYDLSEDIGEQHDLAQDHPELINRIERIFERESRPLQTDQNYNPMNFRLQ